MYFKFVRLCKHSIYLLFLVLMNYKILPVTIFYSHIILNKLSETNRHKFRKLENILKQYMKTTADYKYFKCLGNNKYRYPLIIIV